MCRHHRLMISHDRALEALVRRLHGALLLGAAPPLAPWLGVPVWLTRGLGSGLVVFAIAMTLVARHPRQVLVRQVIEADAAWVAGALAVILGFSNAMTTAGLWALGIATLAVADFAVFQMIGLRRSTIAA